MGNRPEGLIRKVVVVVVVVVEEEEEEEEGQDHQSVMNCRTCERKCSSPHFRQHRRIGLDGLSNTTKTSQSVRVVGDIRGGI
jgi:hypothetical protein